MRQTIKTPLQPQKRVTVSVDTTAPGVSISVSSGVQTDAFSVTITFTEAVSGFTQSDLSLSEHGECSQYHVLAIRQTIPLSTPPRYPHHGKWDSHDRCCCQCRNRRGKQSKHCRNLKKRNCQCGYNRTGRHCFCAIRCAEW